MLDAAPAALSDAQAARVQLVGYVASAASLIGVLYVLVHLLHAHYRGGRPRGRAHMDFAAKLVLVLSLLDAATILARVAGRAPVGNPALCSAQAAVLQAANLGSCLWVCCIAFNLYRWLVAGEALAARQRRFRLYLAVATLPPAGLVVYHLATHQYGDATFYCWLREIRGMFLSFYLLYVLMVVFNFVLLVLIHVNMKQRVARHDTIEADTSSMLIRRKLLLYLVIFIAHRSPMMIYRLLEALGDHHVDLGLFAQVLQDLTGLSNSIVYGGLCRKQASSPLAGTRFDDAESIASPTDSARPYVVSKRVKHAVVLGVDDDGRDSILLRSASAGSFRLTSTESAPTVAAVASTSPSPSTLAEASAASPCGSTHSEPFSALDRAPFQMPLYFPVPTRAQHTLLPDAHQQQLYKERWRKQFAKVKGVVEATQAAAAAAVAIMPRVSSSATSSPPPRPAPRVAIFASTFNMGEKDVDVDELPSWIPAGHDIYVIGVQECMDLGDLQSKVLQHLVRHAGVKYVHYSCEIGKRATALGYHGYIALSIFVRESAVITGRFKMPARPSGGSKSAQEVFRGKSLLVFGRASNKGAVGMSFRYDNASFAFVTCHLASDSSGKKAAKSSRGGGGGGGGSTRRRTRTDDGSGPLELELEGDILRFHHQQQQEVKFHHPPSKVHRRNQDAMEILQQLYLDEEDHGFGFPHLHHHSFILGDFNYRMTRQNVTPAEMLEALAAIGSKDLRRCQSVETADSTAQPQSTFHHLSSPTSPAMLQRASDQSPTSSSSFHEFMTPRLDFNNSDSSSGGLEAIGAVQEEDEDDTDSTTRSQRHDPAAIASSAANVERQLQTLLRGHDELYQLRMANQIFFGFQEHDIAFYPTFRRIRGEALLDPRDTAAFERNYSLSASHGGFRVPSYTDRIMFASLDGMEELVQCEKYTSCEEVTTSDHKPVVATFKVTLPRVQAPAMQKLGVEDSAWNANSSGANPNILQSSQYSTSFLTAAGRMRDVPGSCELRLRIEFRSIRWVDAVDSAAFDRAEHVQFGFLFPLPCEDVFAHQRKLHEVAEHLTWGEHRSAGVSSFSDFASTVTPTTNFHTIKWNDFVERGLRYHTMAGAMGDKHVALLLRAPPARGGRALSKAPSASRLRTGGHSSSVSSMTSLSPTPSGSSVSTAPASSFSGSNASIATSPGVGGTSMDQLFGHGTFCVDAGGGKHEVVVPLTLGGRLLGRLQLRVALRMRQHRSR